MTRLDRIEAALAAADERPWRDEPGCEHKITYRRGIISRGLMPENATLIVSAPADLAWLITQVRALREVLADLIFTHGHECVRSLTVPA